MLVRYQYRHDQRVAVSDYAMLTEGLARCRCEERDRTRERKYEYDSCQADDSTVAARGGLEGVDVWKARSVSGPSAALTSVRQKQ